MTILQFILLLACGGIVTLFACLFAIGHSHAWLAKRGQIFGDNTIHEAQKELMNNETTKH